MHPQRTFDIADKECRAESAVFGVSELLKDQRDNSEENPGEHEFQWGRFRDSFKHHVPFQNLIFTDCRYVTCQRKSCHYMFWCFTFSPLQLVMFKVIRQIKVTSRYSFFKTVF